MSQKYRQTGFRVPRKTRILIRSHAHHLRDFAASEYGSTVDVAETVHIIERWGALRALGRLDNPDYRLLPDDLLPGRDAEFRPRRERYAQIEDDDEHVFVFRESVWVAASKHDPSARETVAHEIGHCVLQHPAASYGLSYNDEPVDRETDSEAQANQFMDEYLMDSRRISTHDGWGEIARKFNVTEESATRRVRELTLERSSRTR